MLIETNPETLQKSLIGKILKEGVEIKSRFGEEVRIEPELVICEKPTYMQSFDESFGWKACEDTYLDRVENLIETAAEKLRKTPYTRRVSLPVWRPEDHFCETPPTVTEISFLHYFNSLHATAYLRSLDALNYFSANFDFVFHVLEEVAKRAEIEAGSVAFLVAAPHIYKRDLDRVERHNYKDVFGFHELGVHIVEDYESTAWHSALEVIYYNGFEKETEWGELFEGQKRSKFVHRLFVEVKNTRENKIHDKAPFTKKYVIDYAHNYVIHAAQLDKPVKEKILREGEEYTYAERARYCERDEKKVDQLYECIKKLRENPYRRDCYVGISRVWDLTSDDPPCLRGYQFLKTKRFMGIFYMRSNDIYGAMHANMYAFSLLTDYVSQLINERDYKYYHFSVDAHIYEEFLDSVKEILEPETPSYISKV